LCLTWVAPLAAQQRQIPGAPGREGERDPEEERIHREMLKKQNKQRQDHLRKDTEKLLRLATELKDYVDKTNEHVLSLDVVRKAEEIEKLAHDVREKMKGQ